jgi:hypothetical protein
MIQKFGHGYVISTESIETYVELKQNGRYLTADGDYVLRYQAFVHPGAETVCSERSVRRPHDVHDHGGNYREAQSLYKKSPK